MNDKIKDDLTKAIRLHDEHLSMKKPPSEKSQRELQRLLKGHRREMRSTRR